MLSFTYTGLPTRVIFERGSIFRLRSEIEGVGCRKALLLSTKEQAAALSDIADMLGNMVVGIFAEAEMHTPIRVTERALRYARERDADCTVAFGGGSATGLSKAIALRSDLKQIVVPTTYAGSEMTPILGESDGDEKKTQRTMKVLPEIVIYDVDYTMSLPRGLSMSSGMNAIAHAVEALYAQDRNPVISAIAELAIRAMGNSLPRIAVNPQDTEARAEAQYAAWLCGMCLGSVGMALHHKLCHVIGGAFNLPHAETHTVILPYALAYNAAVVPDADQAVARALGGKDGTSAIIDLTRMLGTPRDLKSLGMAKLDIDRAVDLVLAKPYWNPRPIERGPIHNLISRAWAGEVPKL